MIRSTDVKAKLNKGQEPIITHKGITYTAEFSVLFKKRNQVLE